VDAGQANNAPHATGTLVGYRRKRPFVMVDGSFAIQIVAAPDGI
jgi:hypothetical protein